MRRWLLSLVACAVACSRGDPPKPPNEFPDGSIPDPMYDANVARWCDLPGSVRKEGTNKLVVPGAKGLPDLSWLDLPSGFCAHIFAIVPNARSLRFAPGRELFVTSPIRGTTGGGPGGRSSIFVLSDDDKNGLAEPPKPFLSNIDATQGILFANGFFYFQDDAKIFKLAYKAGDRSPTSTPVQIADLASRYRSSIHWPKVLDIADDGTIYVANGSDQGEDTNDCSTSRPFRGGIFAIDNGNPMDGKPIAKGFRNPIFLRCQRGRNVCFTSELTKDYSWSTKGREKIVPIREGDDWGYPCCATKDVPFADVSPAPDCSKVADETVSFYVADTPFGFDFEPSRWPSPWTNRIFVALHGQFATWIGARIVAIETDPQTGMPKPGGTYKSDGSQGTTGAALDFAIGWDDGKLDRGRPADVTFSSDGRMFVAQDVGPEKTGSLGIVFWIAPLDLAR